MTREELYALVWSKAVSKLAPDYGLSDVGFRKICVKHDVPTPPLGYWAKLAHGKKVKQTPLPALKSGISDQIYLPKRDRRMPAAEIVVARSKALAREEAIENQIMVPTERPAKLHPFARATEIALNKSKQDHEGFKSVSGAGVVQMTIGRESLERTILLLDAFLRALTQRGYDFVEAGNGLRIKVDGEEFDFRLYNTRDRKTHEPTAADLKQQASRDEDVRRYPSIYKPRIVYALWDYFPSDRLSLEVTDPTRYRWYRENLVGRWHDRKAKRLEDQLSAVIIALVAGAAAIKHYRAEEAEKARLAEEAAERRRQESARRERAKKRLEHLVDLADDLHDLARMRSLEEFLRLKGLGEGNEPADRLTRVLAEYLEIRESRFDRDALNEQIVQMGLFADDDEID